MKKTILTYGLISGAIASVLMLCSAFYYKDHMDAGGGAYFGYAGILLSMLLVFMGVRAYRDNSEGGQISFGKAFQVGILITIISCVCYVLTWMFVYSTIMPDFLEKYTANALEQLRQSGATEAAIQQQAQQMEEYKVMYQNPVTRFFMTFLEPFPVGLLVTLVTAVVLRRKAA